MKTTATHRTVKAAAPRSLYTGQVVTYLGQKVTVVEVDGPSRVCIELPDGSTRWVNTKTLTA